MKISVRLKSHNAKTVRRYSVATGNLFILESNVFLASNVWEKRERLHTFMEVNRVRISFFTRESHFIQSWGGRKTFTYICNVFFSPETFVISTRSICLLYLTSKYYISKHVHALLTKHAKWKQSIIHFPCRLSSF